VCAAYFALQGLLVVAWWALLFARPELAAYFQAPASPAVNLFAFLLPDLAVAAAGSFAASALSLRRSPMAPHAIWLVAGGVTYAALYCVALWLATGAAWLGVALMAPAAALSLAFALGSTRE
jgi:hypothetical protein